jgi:hypothetical protein
MVLSGQNGSNEDGVMMTGFAHRGRNEADFSRNVSSMTERTR